MIDFTSGSGPLGLLLAAYCLVQACSRSLAKGSPTRAMNNLNCVVKSGGERDPVDDG